MGSKNFVYDQVDSPESEPNFAQVLIVDDEESWREALSDEIMSLGYTYKTCNSVEAALSAIQTAHYNFVTIDGLNGGWEQVFIACEAAGIPCCVFTGDKEPIAEAAGLYSHNVTVLEKGDRADLEQLYALINIALNMYSN